MLCHEILYLHRQSFYALCVQSYKQVHMKSLGEKKVAKKWKKKSSYIVDETLLEKIHTKLEENSLD